ncbi:MAG: SAM-dependent methyltransferase [Micromonosporaceae bacterium]
MPDDHEVAQAVAPESRVVHVDNDPIMPNRSSAPAFTFPRRTDPRRAPAMRRRMMTRGRRTGW